MEFRERSLLEQSIRGIVDGGGRFSEDEIINNLPSKFEKLDRQDISSVIRNVLSGSVYNKEGGKYGRNGS
ncbi:MAG: hypothetical protein QG639_683 [Patescibacteria group bacterium]|nr:hypothetical protein [Patescibacteria group bacterium]